MLYALYGERSYRKYNGILLGHLHEKYGQGTFDQEPLTQEILKFCYDWAADKFLELMHAQTDKRFLFYLFKIHEDSIKLYFKQLENPEELKKKEVNLNTLSLNRRVLKLALEQSCDINYIGDNTPDPRMMPGFVMLIEDLLFVGERLFAFAEHMAEQRMMEDPVEFIITEESYTIQRKYHYDFIYYEMEKLFHEGFENGLVDGDAIKGLRAELQNSMKIDYDFAGGQIMEIKRHHSPKAPDLQTVEAHILPLNLEQNGVSKTDAENFYAGLTISRANKFPIRDSVYKSHSFARYFFRPILIVNINGEDRALVGSEKWQESIMVMATNGFQWQQAPEEWKRNNAFNAYLNRKADEHDKLLEDKVKEVLQRKGLPYIHHVTRLNPMKGPAINVETACGEIDFIILDPNCKKVLVTDCKYHRARYEMVGFSTDYSNFKNLYEPKIEKKVKFIADNLGLVQEHFEKEGIAQIDLSTYTVEALFIVNTPTFYILNGKYNTVAITHLADFIDRAYKFQALTAHMPDGERQINHPYFRKPLN